MKGIIIGEPWISKILSGEKTWEMRGTRALYRGPLALIRKGSGQVVGVAALVDTTGELDDDQLRRTFQFHRVPLDHFDQEGRRKWRHAWILEGARQLRNPVPYHHPSGAVVWVRLTPDVVAQVSSQADGIAGVAGS